MRSVGFKRRCSLASPHYYVWAEKHCPHGFIAYCFAVLKRQAELEDRHSQSGDLERDKIKFGCSYLAKLTMIATPVNSQSSTIATMVELIINFLT